MSLILKHRKFHCCQIWFLLGFIWLFIPSSLPSVADESIPMSKTSRNSKFYSYYSYYQLKPHDTLESIAGQFHTSPQVLLKMNPHLKKEYSSLSPGKVICVPRLEHTTPAGLNTENKNSKDKHITRHAKPSNHRSKCYDDQGLTSSELAYLTEYGAGFWRQIGQRIVIKGHPPHANRFTGSDGKTVFIPQAIPAPPVGNNSRQTLSSRRGRKIHAILRTARKFLGIPYVWGGETSQGFDCSGFVKKVFLINGIHLPRTADIQYQTGRPIKRNKEQPGDLVFFETYAPGASHVGIYLGKGYFIHASSSQGVTISSLYEPYFARRYLGAKRVPIVK